MTGINFTDEQEYAPKLSFKNNEVLPLISNAVCECVYEYNDDHHGVCVWQCPKCEAEENEQTDC